MPNCSFNPLHEIPVRQNTPVRAESAGPYPNNKDTSAEETVPDNKNKAAAIEVWEKLQPKCDFSRNKA